MNDYSTGRCKPIASASLSAVIDSVYGVGPEIGLERASIARLDC